MATFMANFLYWNIGSEAVKPPGRGGGKREELEELLQKAQDSMPPAASLSVPCVNAAGRGIELLKKELDSERKKAPARAALAGVASDVAPAAGCPCPLLVARRPPS